LTPKNYTQLAALDKRYRDQGLSILAFPCNQFGGQEPGTNTDIKKFVGKYEFNVDNLFDKIKVNGSEQHPLFGFLKKNLAGSFGSFIKWNFTKFLCDSEGKPIRRFGPKDEPFAMEDDIKRLLQERPGRGGEDAGKL